MSIQPSIGLLAERAIVEMLSAAGAPAPTFRADTKAFTAERFPAYNVFPFKFINDFESGAKSAVEVDAEIRIRCYAKASDSAPVSEAIDPLVVWAHQQIMADETLGRVVQACQVKSGEYAYDEQSDPVIAQVELTVELLFGTLRADPTISADYPQV